MPKIPTRLQASPYGTYNARNPGRAILPALHIMGPAMPQEQFNEPSLDPSVQRALNQIQSNVAQAVGQVKASVFSYANIIRGYTLSQGGTNGASPNIIAHGLTQPAAGALVLVTHGGYITGQAVILPAPNVNLIQLWTQFTAFASQSVTADILVWT